MNDAEELEKIKARLEAPSLWVGGWDPQTLRDMRWLIELVERQAKEIEKLKSSLSRISPMHLAGTAIAR